MPTPRTLKHWQNGTAVTQIVAIGPNYYVQSFTVLASERCDMDFSERFKTYTAADEAYEQYLRPDQE